MGILGKSWGLSDMLASDPARGARASACTVQFLGKQYILGSETLPDKLRNTLKRSQVGTYYIIFKFQVTSETGHTHKVYIQTLPVADLSGPAKVYCDCNDFKFRCAYVLEQHGSLLRSPRTDSKLGEAVTTAPKSQSGTALCKHALAAVQELLRNPNLYLG